MTEWHHSDSQRAHLGDIETAKKLYGRHCTLIGPCHQIIPFFWTLSFSPPSPFVGNVVHHPFREVRLQSFLFVSLILMTEISGRPKPEICFMLQRLGERSCSRSSPTIHSVVVGRTPNVPNERWTFYYWAIVKLCCMVYPNFRGSLIVFHLIFSKL